MNIAKPETESFDEHTKRLKNLNHIQSLKKMINNERKAQCAIFDSLKPGQKRLLMYASGIRPRTSIIYNPTGQFEYTKLPSFNHLSLDEVDNLKKGLDRLQSIIDAFSR